MFPGSGRFYVHLLYLCPIILLTLALYALLYANLKDNLLAPHLQKIHKDELYEKVRVLCMVTYNYKTPIAAYHVKNTWSKYCNVVLFVSGNSDRHLEPFVAGVNATDEWLLVRMGLINAYQYYHSEVDWFSKFDDASFVALQNLRYMVAEHSPSEPIHFGFELQDASTNKSFVYSKAGYVLSKEALRRFTVEAISGNSKHCKSALPGFSEELELARCLNYVGVRTADSRDEFGLETFMPLAMTKELWDGYNSKPWLKTMSKYNANQSMLPISKRAVSFRVAFSEAMYNFHYFLYHVELFGLPRSKQSQFS